MEKNIKETQSCKQNCLQYAKCEAKARLV